MLTALRHETRSYSGRESFATTCADAVRTGLDRDELPMILACAESLDEVRHALGEDVGRATFVPTDEHVRNPSRLVTMLHTYASRSAGGRVFSVCGMTVGGRTSAELSELHLVECILNTTPFAQLPLSVMCLYDSEDLDDDARTNIRFSHPTVDDSAENADFDGALATVLHASELEPPDQVEHRLLARMDDLGQLRSLVKAFARQQAIAADRADDLVLAANEIVTNSLRYGGGRALVQMWADDRSVVLESRDHGYLRDPAVGLIPPRPDASSGRGLWLAHHLCDLVQLRSAETSGTTVRLFVDR